MTIQTWWLSFVDPAKPKGQRFLGVAVVDVDAADMLTAIPFVRQRRGGGPLDVEETDACWLAAAIMKAHQTGCNPGGEVGAARLDPHPDFAAYGPHYPRGRLISREEMAAIEAAILGDPGSAPAVPKPGDTPRLSTRVKGSSS